MLLTRAIFYTYSFLIGVYSALITSALIEKVFHVKELAVEIAEVIVSIGIFVVSLLILDRGSLKPDVENDNAIKTQ
jgi:hypothetical protein